MPAFSVLSKAIATVALVVLLASGISAGAQGARDLQSAQTGKIAGETEEQHGKRLLDAMLVALGGDAWVHKKTQYAEGQTAPFFQGQPSGGVARFVSFKRYADHGESEVTRVEFVTYRGMIEPGTVREVAHLWTKDQGYEFTFKGRTLLPEKQVTDYIRRREHSLEKVMTVWVHEPGVVILYVGAGERDRRPVDKVSILTANNDAVTLELEQGTHLPLQRSFEWRNDQFKDHDLDEEVYGDWRVFDGIATPMNMTDYRNGDIVSQTFYKKVKFNEAMDGKLFDPERKSMK